MAQHWPLNKVDDLSELGVQLSISQSTIDCLVVKFHQSVGQIIGTNMMKDRKRKGNAWWTQDQKKTVKQKELDIYEDFVEQKKSVK